jgi:hypothetical protein
MYRMSTYISFAIWSILLIWITVAVNGLLRRVGTGRWVVIAFFPAVLVRQLSQLLICLITFAKIREVNLYADKGVSIIHDRSKLWHFGEILIALAPMVGCAAMLSLLCGPLDTSATLDLEKPLDVNLSSLNGIAASAEFSFKQVSTLFHEMRSEYFDSWGGFLFFYLAVALSLNMAPGRNEVSYATLGIVLFCILTALFDSLTRGPAWGLYEYGERLINSNLEPRLDYFVTLQLYLLLGCLLAAGLAKLLGLYGLKPVNR